MRAIILEDEQLATKRLVRMLEEVAPSMEILESFQTVEDTASYLLNVDDIDLIFLDIHVADGNSFELFHLVDVNCKVIFITAYDEYAIDAFRKNAIDYLLKPLKKDQLAEAISRAKEVSISSIPAIPSEYKSRIIVKFLSKLNSIKTSDIAYIFSKNKISYIYTTDGARYPSDYKLQDLTEMLDPKFFFRVNRQFLVHIDSISQIQRHQASRVKLELNPPINEQIVISTDKTPLFREWLDR